MNCFFKIFLSAILVTLVNNMHENRPQEMKNKQIITKYKDLAQYEGEKVNVCGIYVKHNHMPQFTRSNIQYLSGLLLEGDTVPQLFIESPRSVEEQNKFDGKKVKLSGTFYTIQPLEEGDDPVYTARIYGSWIYNVGKIELVNK